MAQLTLADVPEELRVLNQSFYSLVNTWNNDYFQIVAGDAEESEKLRQLRDTFSIKRKFLDVSYRNAEYVS